MRYDNPWLRLLLLAAVLTATSGYRFRCYMFCLDQTAVQDDYVEQRDRCREFAQLKLDTAMHGVSGPKDDKARKGMLVQLFSECMGRNGWTVPDGKGDKDKDKLVAAPIPTGPPLAVGNPTTTAAAAKSEDKAAASRAAECAFARHSSDVSTNAAARAKACDVECARRLQATPDGPRPAACAPIPQHSLSTGVEKE